MGAEPNSFYLKRLFSLAGIFPIGAFLLQHFFSNAYVFLGPQAFNDHTDFLTSLPLVVLIEIGFIYLPILFHAALGLVIIYRGQNNFVEYGYPRNWMYFGQRITGIIALVFIGIHAYTTRIQSFFSGTHFHYADMKAILSDPYWFWFYVIGVVAVCFHFANGLWSFLATWGIALGPKSQRLAASVSWGLFVGLSGLGVLILMEFVR